MESVVGSPQVGGVVERLIIDHLVGKLAKLVLPVFEPGALVKVIGWQCQKLVVNIGELLPDLVKSRFHDIEVNR